VKGEESLSRARLPPLAPRPRRRGSGPELPKLDLVTIDDPLFGGWAKTQPEHFGEGGVFDQIYRP